jgi:site-specific DNA-methyltransferase (adenine-specific)
VDAIITDPPYGLEFMGKQWDGKVPGPEYWREALRVAKPGAYLLAFGGTRTAHRLACAIEDAGWEIRDCLSWLYGSGFPKSHDVSKAIDREAGAERSEVLRAGVKSGCSPDANTYASGLNVGFQQRELLAPATPAAAQWNGWGTALKPAWEPIYLARKPLVGTVASNVLVYGCGGLNVDGCRIGTSETLGRFNHARTEGTSYVVQREDKLIDNSGGLGRWPANLCLDESAAAMLDEQSGTSKSTDRVRNNGAFKSFAKGAETARPSYGFSDSGGASRFFYVAKASRAEREAGLNGNGARANTHPTVKPIALMRWLVRLVTPPNGIVLDPFNGSGTTGIAAIQEGMRYLGIEISPDYAQLAERRIAHALEAAA